MGGDVRAAARDACRHQKKLCEREKVVMGKRGGPVSAANTQRHNCITRYAKQQTKAQLWGLRLDPSLQYFPSMRPLPGRGASRGELRILSCA